MSEQRRPARRRTSIRKGGARRVQARPRDPTRHERSGPSREVRELLERFGLRAQKGFGQNFLTDRFALGAILEAAALEPSDQVLEVGPGLGVLTRALAERAGRVVAVEIDRGMVAALGELLADCPNVEIVEGDALHVDPVPLVGAAPYKVVANLPYYITSALLRHFFEAARPPTRLVVMLQREVAERIVAKAGDLSLLAVSVQYYGQPAIVGRIPASAFFPAPKVDSAILRVDVRDRPAVDVEPGPFFKVVSAGFAMPRKQLHNALPQKIWMAPGAAEDALRAAAIDPARRAQTLTLEEWAALTRELQRRGMVQ
jgi:16S rRNA (adenine1518-N6/adenine1519-N6)-dimethyltransferase